ncbi:hypothetical protein GP486_006074 [Trichoglossum hirsutum]|uniref:Mitochondrial division protein 1 n=1 Tax=Trichoglossum hirsutum TaxID=265104 RepID=A0A9P8L810_9PEZI|nr:hypothetical protein GP486_006074 [Trichoglossum hirsutum]
MHKLEGHSDSVRTVAYSPDGRLVASGSCDGTIRLWDDITGLAVRSLEGHSGWVESVAFSPDGRLVASGSADRTIRLWDTTTGATVRRLEGHSDWVWAVAFSPDGRLVASGSSDGTIRLWDTTTGYTLRTLECYSDRIQAMAFSPDGRLVASGLVDGTIRLLDAATGDVTKVLKRGNSVERLSFSQDGSYLDSDGEHITLGLPTHFIPPRHPPLYGLDQARQWVTWNSHNILFLPPDRRPYDFAVKDNILIIGHRSGRLTYFEFSPDIQPFVEL